MIYKNENIISFGDKNLIVCFLQKANLTLLFTCYFTLLFDINHITRKHTSESTMHIKNIRLLPGAGL